MHNEVTLKRIAIFTIVIFYASVFLFSVNIPQQDDYDSILAYLLGSQDDLGSGLFDMHVSHRIVLTRLLAKFSLVFGNGVDFRLLTYLGSLSLLGVVLMLYRRTVNVPNRQLLFCVLCLSLFSLFHWSNMTWATASVQNYIIVFIVIACFYLFESQAAYSRAGAVALGFIAAYINSSGLLLLPILFVWAIASPTSSKRNGAQILIIGVTTLISFYFFFWGFGEQSLEQMAPPIFPSSGFSYLVDIVKAYLISCAGYLHFEPLALCAGLIVNLYFLLLIKCRYYQKNRTIFYSYLFLLLSFALVALFRNELGIRQVIASRYQVYTVLINALLVISFFDLGLTRYIPYRYLNQLVLVMFSLLYLASLYYLSNLISEKNRIEQGIVDLQNGETSSLYHPDPARAEQILERSVQAGVYQLPGGT